MFEILLTPEVLIGGGSAAAVSLFFVYNFLFKGKAPAKKTKAELELEALQKTVEAQKEKVQEKPRLKSLNEALTNTRQSFWGRISSNMSSQKLDRNQLEFIEEVLYTSDLGPKTVQRLFSKLEANAGGELNADGLKELLRKEIVQILEKGNVATVGAELPFKLNPSGTTVWMVVGVNGAGKTTTIGKLASQLQAQGKKVLIAAGDTFRAAADEQLRVWSERAQVEIYSPDNTKDPSAIGFDAIKRGLSQNFDVVIVDTAGRLHTQKNLMEELKKIHRVMDKAMPGAPHEVILVLDANSGQNALVQAEQFHQALGVNGVILTKMDGSAKGGVAVGIACDVGLTVKMIGVGEAVEDLRPFSPTEFANSIL